MRSGRKPGTPKTGGRKQGVPNKSTAAVAERLRELHCDPVTGLATLAMDETVDVAVRARIYTELLKYLAPQLRSIEHAMADDGQLARFTIHIGNRELEHSRSGTKAPPRNIRY